MTQHSRLVPVVEYESAANLVSHAMQHARENSWVVAVAVIDPWGTVVASGRMDSVPIHENGDVIRAIGVSGTAGQEDVACVEAALSVRGLSSNEHATLSFEGLVSFEMTKQRHVAPDKRSD